MNEYLQFLEIKGTIDICEADNFIIKKRITQLSSSQIVNRTESYTFKAGVLTVDISETKHDYYLKNSKTY